MASAFLGPLTDLFVVLLAAYVIGWVFQQFRQPSVIGEVVGGVLVGPSLLGLVHEGPILEFVAELGAIFLLFLIGVETRLHDILRVGREAAMVGTLGVLVPFFAGWGLGHYVGFSLVPALFLGTALVATSVGITARVLQEIGVLSRTYSRIILGAAVIDDVLGLIVLAIVSGVAVTGGVVLGEIGRLIVFSLLFVAGSALLVPFMGRLPISKLPFNSPLAFALVLGVGMATLSALIGLAPIIGAFFAGMLLAEVQGGEDGPDIEGPITGVATLLTPIFFGVVGLKLDLTALVSPYVLTLGSAVTIVAVLGKLVGGFGALKHGWKQATVVGMGMVPRGEVGLIVAALGLSAGAVDNTEYAVVLFVVVVTTLIAPLALRPLIRWADPQDEEPAMPPERPGAGGVDL